MKKTEAKPYAGTRLVKFPEKRILELRTQENAVTNCGRGGFLAARHVGKHQSAREQAAA